MTVHQFDIIFSAITITSKLKLICFNVLVFLLTQSLLDVLSQKSMFFLSYYNSSENYIVQKVHNIFLEWLVFGD